MQAAKALRLLACLAGLLFACSSTTPDDLDHPTDGGPPKEDLARGDGGGDLPGPTGPVLRGPYLQMATESSITIRFRTSEELRGQVFYGPAPGPLSLWASESKATTDHVIVLSGLAPATRYAYNIGSTTQVLQGDSSFQFTTPPKRGLKTYPKSRIWVLGDSGTADDNARAVRDAFVTLAKEPLQHPDLMLLLGDNAYDIGTDAQYQTAVFDMYQPLLRQIPVWPTLGNHDGFSAKAATESGPYFDIFTLPRAAEAGGVPSGTEAYYSFDYGPIHFVCLDSFESLRTKEGPMLRWLRDDLLANQGIFTVAFFHHPPYTKGSHDSDLEIELIEMRENALPILESFGVDLVLTGHSHSYERSILLDRHYADSTTLAAAMKKDPGSGREELSGSYKKGAIGPAGNEGVVYVVSGSSGLISGGALNHPAMFVSLNELGSLILDVEVDGRRQRLEGRFLTSQGAIADWFVVEKGCKVGPCGTQKVELRKGQGAFQGVADVSLKEGVPMMNHGAEDRIQVDGDDGTGKDYVGLLRFDLSSVPRNAVVTSVTLTLDIVNESPDPYLIHRGLRPFVEKETTWEVFAQGMPWEQKGGRGVLDRRAAILGVIAAPLLGERVVALNPVGIQTVQEWVANPLVNFGLVIDNPLAQDGLAFSSSEANPPTKRPKLTLTYR